MIEKKKWYKNTTTPRMVFISTMGILLVGITFCGIYDPLQWRQEKPRLEKPKIERVNQQLSEIINIIEKKRPRIDPAIVKPIAKSVLKYSKMYNFPPELVVCVIDRESSFNTVAVSTADCVGLMQINEKWHKEKLKKLGIKSDQLFHIDNNINIGCMILREYYNGTKSINKALTKYVGGKHPSYVCDILSDFTNLILSKKKL